MKITIDVECPRWMKVAARVPIPVLAIALAGAALAAPPKTFTSGETLSAADLNANFAALDGRVTGLEASPLLLESVATTAETAANGSDFVYQAASLDLTPGTWRLDAFAMVNTSLNADAVQIGLWDDTNAMELANTRSAVAQTGQAGPCVGSNNMCASVSLTTSAVVTIATATTVRIKAFRNGNSQLQMGATGLTLPPGIRITALRLH